MSVENRRSILRRIEQGMTQAELSKRFKIPDICKRGLHLNPLRLQKCSSKGLPFKALVTRLYVWVVDGRVGGMMDIDFAQTSLKEAI